MLEIVVFYNGPRTQWSGKVVDDDVIARVPAAFLWLARAHAKHLIQQLNTGRCGYVITRGGKVIDEALPA
jgi:hypothetical protein